MNDKLDNILADEADLVPSSGFLASVMESVIEEAAAPPPIPFPWKRAIPGMILAGGVLSWGGFELVSYIMHGAPLLSLHQLPVAEHLSARMEQGLWTGVACGAAIASWVLARRIAGRSGLI
ncbi:MAG TPA: hypothetical protein VN375_01730 [Vicinamibacteria bacterium]|nr:hypothetical protein [Vicinamibacteria bacterium]